MKINQIIHEAGTGLEIDRSIPGRTIARISGDVAYRTGSPTGKKLPDYHPDDDYTPWSGKISASTHDDEEDTFDVDYMGDDGELKEFVTPQATAQDPGLEREKDVDVVFYGQMPRDFTADTVAEALEAVLPREYPPGSSDITNSNVYRVVTEIAKHQGAVVTTKPLSIAQKLVKTFQTYGIKCRIDAPGLEEGDVVQFPKKHKSDLEDTHSCVKCGGDLQGGTYMGHKVKVCMPCKQVYLPPNTGIDQRGNKVDEQGLTEDDAHDVEQRMIAKIAKYKEHLAHLKKTDPEAYQREMTKSKTSSRVPPVSTFEGVAEGLDWLDDRAAKNIHKLKRDHSKDKKVRPAPAQQDGEDWEQRQIEKMKKYRSPEQGVAEGSLNEFAVDGFNGGDDGEEFNPNLAKMAQEDGFTKGASLADGATLQRAMAINDWDKHDGGIYSQHFAKGFIAGRKDKIRHNNKQYNLKLQLMKDGSIRHGEQGVAEMDSQGYKGSRDDYELGKGKEHTGKATTTDKMIKAAKKVWDYATEPVDAPDMHTYKRNRAKNIAAIRKNKGVDEGTAGLPDPNDFDSDWEYQDAMDAYGKTQDTDSDFENMIDEPDDWFDESREKIGNMDADAFDDALARLKKLAGSGPLKTVYDPTKRVYKNVPTAVQPAQQPRKK